MERSPIFNTAVQDFLNSEVVNRPYLYLDYWSVIHFISGFILGLILLKYHPNKFSWLIVLALLIGYEFFEVLLNGILFVPETFIDTFWDIIVGMTGFFIGYKVLKIKKF